MEKPKINIFKPYLNLKQTYKGGITRGELASKVDKVYKLSSNENYFGTSPKAIQAIKDNLHLLNEYPDRTDARLCEALRQFYNDELPTEQFIAASSGSEILDMAIRAFMDDGLECIVSNPFFLPYQMFSRWQNAVVKDVPLLAPNFDLDVDGILGAITDKTRLLFITSPNNPTGTYIPKETLDRLIHAVPDHVVIVMDEVYFHFANADDYTNAMSYIKEGKKIIAVNSFSKAYGMAALRVGYAYTTKEIASYIRQIAKPFLINLLSLEAAIAALSDKEFLDHTATSIRRERQWLYGELDKMGVHYWPSQANFILIKPNVTDVECTSSLLEKGVMVRPSANFGAPGCVRVTIGDREANQAYIDALSMFY